MRYQNILGDLSETLSKYKVLLPCLLLIFLLLVKIFSGVEKTLLLILLFEEAGIETWFSINADAVSTNIKGMLYLF